MFFKFEGSKYIEMYYVSFHLNELRVILVFTFHSLLLHCKPQKKARQIVYTRVFCISITDFAWASQCLIFRPFEPQKMLIRCLKFTLTRFTFGMKIGSFGPFLAEWLFCRMHLHNSSLNGTQSQSNIYLKGLFKVKVWISSASVNA